MHLKIQISDFLTLDIDNKNWYLYICMSLNDLENHLSILKAVSQKTNHLLIYCFDTWESEYTYWEDAFKKIKPYCVFFAYKESHLYFKEKGIRTGFVPQSMDEQFFFPHNVSKERLFMQMGRKNTKIHDMIIGYLERHNILDTDDNYVYERHLANIIYPDTMDLAENISRTRFFVCAPQSLENSKLTGKISDVTARFYEAMACKAIIIGFKPDTYDELFPSDSMIELNPDGSDFDEKIDELINNVEEYDEKVNVNYQYLQEKHRWKNRLDSMLEIVKEYEKG